jgi:hypothetical protein
LPAPTSPALTAEDPIRYRSAREAAALMAMVVVGGLAVTVGIAALLYRRDRNARRRYVFVQPAGAHHR